MMKPDTPHWNEPFAASGCWRLQVGNQLLDALGICLVDVLGRSQTSLSIGRFLGQDMPSKSPFDLDSSRSGLFETFCRSSVCF